MGNISYAQADALRRIKDEWQLENALTHYMTVVMGDKYATADK